MNRTNHQSPIKVMHLIHSLSIGGAEQVVASYARNLERTHFAVSVCALRSGGSIFEQLRNEGIHAYLIGKRKGADPRTLWRLVGLLRAEKIDILHTHNPPAHGWGVLAATTLPKLILIATEHSIHYAGRGGRAYSALIRLPRNRFAKVISCSERVARTQMAYWGLPSDKHVIIHNGIDTSRYNGVPKSGYLTKEFHVDPSCPVIGAIGSLTPQKGHAVLVDALASLKREGHKIQALIVGEGPLRGELLRKISLAGLDGQVSLTGIREDIPEILANLDLFVLPSLREGFPITILEAMAAGLPIIASDVGGISEAIVNRSTGILVPAGDANALAQAIAEVLGNEEFKTRMGKEAREYVRTQFSVAKMIRETESLYSSQYESPAFSTRKALF